MTYVEYIKQAITETINGLEDENTLKKLYSIIMAAIPDVPTSEDNSEQTLSA